MKARRASGLSAILRFSFLVLRSVYLDSSKLCENAQVYHGDRFFQDSNF